MELISFQALAFVLAGALALGALPAGAARKAGLLSLNLVFLASFDARALLVFGLTALIGFGAARLAAGGASRALVTAAALPLLVPLFLPKLDFGSLLPGLGLADAALAVEAADGGLGNVLGSRLVLFIGASYFTLRALHFVIDAFRRRALPLGFFDYLIWNSFFPTIVAGPIERADHFAKTYGKLGRPDRGDLEAAAIRIFHGLLKQVVLAPIALAWAHPIANFSSDVALGAGDAWLALYAICLYAYFDFAGYSDLAIGAARLYGIRLAENFDNPYLRPSIAEFWRGWHLSLSYWIRDYLFLPMCGRSRSLLRPHVAALASMTLCGLWHAPQRGWILWGLAHGIGLSAHQAWTLFLRKRFALKKKLGRSRAFHVAAVVLTFHFVALTWVLISIDATDLRPAGAYFARLFGFGPAGAADVPQRVLHDF